MITKDIEKRIRELRYKQSSWKKCLKVESLIQNKHHYVHMYALLVFCGYELIT